MTAPNSPTGPGSPGRPSGYGAPSGAPRRRTGPIVGVVVAALVLIGGGVTGFLLLTGDDTAGDTAAGSARATAEAWVAAVNDKDIDAEAALTCDSLDQQRTDVGAGPGQIDPAALDAVQAKVELVSITVNGDSATAVVAVKLASTPADFSVELTKGDQGWQVCGFGMGTPAGGTPGTAPDCGADCAPAGPEASEPSRLAASAAREFADAFNDRDVERLRATSCRSLAAKVDTGELNPNGDMSLEYQSLGPARKGFEVHYEMHGVSGGSGDNSVGAGSDAGTEVTMKVIVADGRWVVCDPQ